MDAQVPDIPDGRNEFVSPSELAGLPTWSMMASMSVRDALDGAVQCGVDLVEVGRIREVAQRYGERFLTRVWTERELVICRGRYPELAARFAGKEATMKALGTGVVGIGWKEIEILPDRRGKPLVFLHDKAKARAAHLRLNTWAISLTHSKELACAMVIAVAGPERA
ncbi:MAG TPA: holo-ACP synthase [Chloroflexia bacterium]|nr:holo-ACP synthase [Chloroflexia bacterium]